ncbi:DsbA family oxidoreductase [Solirubrobacter soli]|uniref:DsbA family oxidoreductase n=1 Tax=Solirubrobacter soli TaxID=363832 RepID=UPI001B7F8C7E|nr:DsbA family oxidoreductase [Solirubrobacter soli]
MPIKVDVWSDIACPWCYIGKRKFEAGARAFDGDVEVTYHSFELAPDTPVDFDGSEIDFLTKHKGMSAAQVRPMLDRVAGIAKDVGLDYDFDALQHTNTLKAHQLLHFAKQHGKQLELKERLLKAYFVEGKHVGRDSDLADLAQEVGLDRDEALQALADTTYENDVRQDIAQARAYGINGVPFFVIEGKYGVSGAQDAATFTQVLQKVAAERGAVPVPEP